MAVTYHSKSATTQAGMNETPVNVTLPTGTVEGNFLLVHASTSGANGSQNVFQVVGGTQLTTGQIYKNGDGFHSSSCWCKFATSTDISNGYIQINTDGPSYSINVRCNVYRFSGVQTSIVDNDDIITLDVTPSYNNTITPTVPNSVIVFLCAANLNGTASGYAITTSSPSFTEITDETWVPNGSSDTLMVCAAYGTRPETTATGNSSLTFSGDLPNSMGILIALAPLDSGGSSSYFMGANF